MDLSFNEKAAFTRWIVRGGGLREDFVVIDVGVQGGENPRWHILRDHLVVHGFDAIEEAVDALKRQTAGLPGRHYHLLAVGNADEERTLFFNPEDPRSSSLYSQGADRFRLQGSRVEQARTVGMRRLDTLLASEAIPHADFVKIDVEGFEKEVILGARTLLSAGVLGMEVESSFGISPTYPKTHFATMQELLLEHQLLVFDINFNRIPRASFQRTLLRKGLPAVDDQVSVGKPATLSVLFCRDLIAEAEEPQSYTRPIRPVSVDQIVKMMAIYELHGLNDIALDTAEHFRTALSGRFDVDHAITLLADPDCRFPGGPGGDLTGPAAAALRHNNDQLRKRVSDLERSTSWRATAPLRALTSFVARAFRRRT